MKKLNVTVVKMSLNDFCYLNEVVEAVAQWPKMLHSENCWIFVPTYITSKGTNSEYFDRIITQQWVTTTQPNNPEFGVK